MSRNHWFGNKRKSYVSKKCINQEKYSHALEPMRCFIDFSIAQYSLHLGLNRTTYCPDKRRIQNKCAWWMQSVGSLSRQCPHFFGRYTIIGNHNTDRCSIAVFCGTSCWELTVQTVNLWLWLEALLKASKNGLGNRSMEMVRIRNPATPLEMLRLSIC